MSRIAVLMGGKSAERDVSLRTGKAIAEALRAKGHETVEIDAAGNLARDLMETGPEAAFLALHGRWGEDGTVQGMLEIMGIPYTGSGVAASALAMDKILSKILFLAKGIPTPGYALLGPDEGADKIGLKPPFVIKPPKEGSTIGISIVKDAGETMAAVAEARKFAEVLLVEEFVPGRELTVGVLNGRPLPIVEIAPESGFYDYHSKYTPGRTNYYCPAALDAVSADKVSQAGLSAYLALGCSGAARVDVILDKAGNPWVIEVNTIPGMTPTSLLPKAALAAGMDFGGLVEEMLKSAGLKA